MSHRQGLLRLHAWSYIYGLPIVFLLLGGVYLSVLVSSCDDCQARGGKFVQGVVWYECVEVTK
jgi:hypothetical protein